MFVFIAARHYDQAEETARTAAAALWPKADQGDPQAMSLWGGLTLQRAIIAARTNDADTAYSELERAGQMAERLGDGHNEFNTEFGPVNVRLYEIAVAVELGDAGRALRAAATVDTSGLSAERQSRMLIDVARAHAQRRQIGEAVAALVQAEDITPELIRGHDLARQTRVRPAHHAGPAQQRATRPGGTHDGQITELVSVLSGTYFGYVLDIEAIGPPLIEG